MNEIPSEVARASYLLRRIEPPVGMKLRVFRQLVRPPPRQNFLGFRFVVIGATLLIAASAAALTIRAVLHPTVGNIHKIDNTAPAPAKPRPARRSSQRTISEAASPNDVSVAGGPAVPTQARSDPSQVASRPAKPTSGPVGYSARPIASKAEPIAPIAQPSVEQVSDLSLQLSEYRAAVATLRDNPQAGIGKLRSFRQRWPQSVIMHEVDLKLVTTLQSQGRRDEAIAEAQALIRRYPNSPKIDDMRKLIDTLAK